ncbi:CPBP family intramembrane glutamic endopeptidase [Oceanirhabdus sp. W0125-5]|uniref:CPBP family intramembrane glutamic endopeptidase n=1 Tax=Oceanirhabdus sp. W0125-5 TaxID=2999116 RepID=UPI0022F2F84B|nr:CPBP family intramembrane glutamic endopeptidase [Oceanirhabdus sp. W0125-5]WBW96936.1 CPBP family intramembrane metalloprotease [Oceanirhabdus sp. W0125-5]
MLNTIISVVMQGILFLIIPVVWYVLFNKKKEGFWRWVGVFKVKGEKWIRPSIITFITGIVIMVLPLILFEKIGLVTKEMFYMEGISDRGLNVELIVIILLRAVIQTAFLEEVLFRGFIGKRVSSKFGFITGNIVQSIIFGIPHGLPFILVYKNYIVGITLIIGAAAVGALQFWLNEKKADGSIIPSFTIHSIMNILSFMCKSLGVSL